MDLVQRVLWQGSAHRPLLFTVVTLVNKREDVGIHMKL